MIDNTILSHLIYNETYARKVLPFIKEEYFTDKPYSIIFKLIYDYVEKYNAIPTKEALYIDLSKSREVNETEYATIKNKIAGLVSNETTDLQWLVDHTEKFCQERALFNAIRKSIGIMDNTEKGNLDKGSIPKLVQDALNVSFDTSIGHDLLEDWEIRYELYHKVENKVPFDIEKLNTITKGGFSRKTLNVFLGGTGVGKTLCMCHMAAANMVAGRNVLYITLEMAEEKIAERIDANLLNVNLNDLTTLTKEEYQKAVTDIKDKTVGKLIIKEYPTATVNSSHFRFLLTELRLKKEFVPDIIYVDYLNLCTSSRIKMSGKDSYGYIKAISEELRGLAVEFNLPIVSATQLNREGFTNSDADLTHTSESFGLPQTADFMAVLISTEELDSLGQYMVKQLKNRYNPITYMRKFVIGVDRDKMRLYDVEEEAQPINDVKPSGMKDKFKGFH